MVDMETPTNDSFALFVKVMLGGLTGAHEIHAIRVIQTHPLEALDIVKAAERAGGMTEEVILQFAPATLRNGGSDATLDAFFSYWHFILYCIDRYKWSQSNGEPKRIVVVKDAQSKKETGAGRPGSMASKLVAAFKLEDTPEALFEKLKQLKTDFGSWQKVCNNLQSTHGIELQAGYIGVIFDQTRIKVDRNKKIVEPK